MKAPGSEKTVRLSLLDRLVDRKPKVSADESMSWRESVDTSRRRCATTSSGC